MNKGYRKGNKYITEGNVTKVFFNNCNDYFLCDTEDIDVLNKHTWYKTNRGYAATHVSDRTRILAHVLIMGKCAGYEIDHINHNKLDNRKENLRHINHSGNIHNTNFILRLGNNPATGVEYRNGKTKTSYIAYISVDSKKKHLGCYETLEEAIRARREAEVFYWGEQANA